EVYSKEYGAYTRLLSHSYLQNSKYYENDAVSEGLDLEHSWVSSSSYLSFEPYGMYIRGLNAQNTRVYDDANKLTGLVTGDQLALRKPTLRTWVNPEKLDKKDARYGNIDDFDLNLYDELKLHTTIENQQLEVLQGYNRKYYQYTGTYANEDLWKNTPQTIGGARGAYFEPVVKMVLPIGVAPLGKDGKALRLYDNVLNQDIDFEAAIHDITGLHETTLNKDVTDKFDVKVRIEEGRFVLVFTVNEEKSVDIQYLQTLIISPLVKVIDNIEGNVEIIANSARESFNPMVSDQYKTGSVPSTSQRDTHTIVTSITGKPIAENDRLRPDSTSTWKSNMGVLKITEPLIKETKLTDDGVKGELELKVRQASIKNTSKTLRHPTSAENDTSQVDPAGKHWYLTEVNNDIIKYENPYEESHTAGDVHHSRFVFTYLITNFARVTEEVRIKIGNEVFKPEDIGYTVDYILSEPYEKDDKRMRVQFVVTPPEGRVLSQESFKFLFEVILIDGFTDDVLGNDEVWTGENLKADSYVSLITDDKTVSKNDPRDFIIQDESLMNYTQHIQDSDLKFNMNGDDKVVDYAHDDSAIEIIKPKVIVRKNTQRPRIEYTSGQTGDNYYNSSDDIIYAINHLENTGAALKEMVMEDILPTDSKTESSIDITRLPITTQARTVSTGIWHIPQEMVDIITADGKNLHDIYKVYVYASTEDAIDGYEAEGWTLLNDGGTNIDTNEVLTLDRATRKIRVVLKTLDHENYLIPKGTKLAIDTDPSTPELESVLESDPDNLNVKDMSDEVFASSIQITMRALSDASSTLFIYNNAQAWANYVADAVLKLDQSSVRSYLTPSRPVLNVEYDAKNFRIIGEDENDDFIYGWSDNTNINPHQLPHLKFKTTFTNADESMWSEDEKHIYAKDLLIDPFVSFELPNVMASLQGKLDYIETVGKDSPLNEDYVNKQGLLNSDNGKWTWYLEKKDGSQSELEIDDFYTGSWNGFSNNVLNIWFKGNVEPGDKIIVEFIGAITFFAVPEKGDLQSKAKISNNTGLLTPLNSEQNRSNKLGYMVDSYDLDRNNSTSNRLVFQDKNLFTYENVDNFKKSKKSISELNLAGTEYPELTPMKQNGVVKFDITIDNSQLQENRTYPYPIFYDVLPHVGDTSIFNPSEARNSKFNALLLTDTIQLEIEGSENKIFTDKDYTSYVGPFKKTGTTIEKVDLPQGAETEKFYDDLGVPGKASAYRDAYFVTLADFNKYAKGREHEIESILALFNNAAYEMPANSKIRLNYDMKSLINAPVMLDETLNPSDYAILNSFSATQRVLGFKPQESNLAGAYTTELKENSYFGGYIWHDYNINGVQDEGTLWTDSNGRQLLKPDDKDYGINDVVVTLQTDTGYDVDAGGFAIKQDTDNEWYVVDEATGDFLIDEVFLEKILSSGPTITHTQMDYHGNAGYYVFSNIPKRKYKVVYEFDSQYDKYGQTTQITKEVKKNGLISLIEDLDLTQAYTDEELMNFDIGIAQQILLGGNVFLENERIVSGIEEQFNGIKDKDELGIENSEISLKDIDGNILKDINGNPYITHTDDKGDYEFVITPLMRNAYLSITVYPNDPVKQKSTVISPVRINTDPFLSSDDNDGYYVRSDRETRSDNLSFALDELYDEDFADRTSVYFGFYERSNTATIGDKVWDDLNQNGIQDIGEPGIEHQELWLHQYALIDDKYELITEDFMSTKTNASGLYYFRKVPTMVEVSGIDYPAYYKVSLKNLVKGYNISLNNQGSIEIDNNFLLNGLTLDDDFIEIIGKDEDGNYDEYEPIDVNNIDLGLHKHQLGSLSGSLFEDTNKDGFKNDTSNLDAYPGFIINLEVKDKNGAWIKAQADENDQMLEPGIKGKDIQTFGKEYNFENLMIVNPEIKADGSYERFEYRIVISQVPQWFEPTPQTLGGDLTINNDFKERDILNNNFRTLETETITLKVSKSDDSMVAVDTFVAVSIENVDFALAPLIKTRDISGILWVDGIVYDAILQENIIDLDKRDGILDSDEHLRLSDTSVYLYRKDVDKKVLRPVVDADGNHIQTLTDAQGYYEFKGLDLADYDKADPNSDTFDPNWKYYNQAIEYVVSFNRKTRHESTLYAVDANLLDSDFIQLSKVDEEKEYTDLDKTFSLYNKDGSKITIDQHMLVSNVGLLANKNGGKVDYYNTQNVSLNAGVIEHDTIKEISGTLFEDLDKNGVQDINTEKSIKDIQVSLHVFDYTSNKWIAKLDDKGKAMQVKTDENGNYSFEVEVADMNINSDHYQKVYRYRVVSEPRFANQEVVYRYTLDKKLNARFEYIDEPLQGLEPDNLYTDLVSKEITLAAEKDGLVDLSSIYDEDRIKENLSVDAGFALYKSYVNIGGRLWHEERPEDGQENHIRDDHELAFVNQKVFLYRKVGTQWFLTEDLNGNSSMTTDKDGYYEFKVAPTSFTVDDKSTWQYRVVTKRDAWQKFADVNQGTDLQIDSNFLNAYDLTTMTSANALWGVSQIFDIADTVDGVIDMGTTRTDLTMDAGISTYQKTAKLGGIVSLDLDETRIRNVSQIPVVKEVTLWKFSQRNLVWEKIETVNIDEFGYYEFEVLPTNFDPLSNDYLKPYAYRVSAQREGYQAWTLSNQGSDMSNDSNISNADDLGLPGISGVHTGVTEEFDIYDGLDIKTITDDLDMGIGYVEFPNSVRLSGKVWQDTNFDGIKQDEELGETDREVTLWKQNPINSVWEHVDTTLTTTDGYYSFMAAPTSYDQDSLEYLLPYTYRINVKRSSNEVFSPYLQGT
ncbi:MAG: hypothetical protein GX038_07145, partial [Erysipelothrix sp.]|nr:hypothetical protein [Erysipelothrix sp.]